MNRRASLPQDIARQAFATNEARAFGVSRGRLRAADLRHPHHGIYAALDAGDDDDTVGRCRLLLPALGPEQLFSGRTAAALWGMPLPRASTPPMLEVISAGGGAAMRRPGVIGSRTGLILERRDVDGVPVLSPTETWCRLAAGRQPLAGRWLVATADFLLSGRRGERGRTRPLTTRAELEAAVVARGSARGARSLRSALDRARSPVDSPQETLLRVALVDAGIPEPQVQVAVRTAAGVRHADLGWPEQRVLLEYQGDEHRSSRRRWLEDLTRVQLLEDAGYRVILVGSADLDDGAGALAARIRRALA
ncbi:hypothetical protein CBF90_08690 [Microbacterium sp. AISO3]|uniref:DUF559 domain-containing protein n=1 Tax=Microbacterium arborescens TaxID=33883 RepID=A0ABX2WEV0_9MICO|nr:MULTISPECIES: hypothetical protein [Microbacterium]OAZ38946.1 hypothetical protein A9Z40_09610 [Microbacterium arborescens]OWP22262.1 hypothetical protein CBF90_08690 [Microbacterium sp. AISO3]